MKKLLVLLFSLLISFNSYGGLFDKTVCVETETVERGGLIYLPNKTKPFSGKNLCKNENSQITSEGKIKKGRIISLTVFTYDENKIWFIHSLTGDFSYDEFKRAGVVMGGVLLKATTFSDTGQKLNEVEFLNGRPIGKHRMWHRNGQQESEINYKNFQKNGEWIEWDKNGQVVSESNWKDGDCISGDCPS